MSVPIRILTTLAACLIAAALASGCSSRYPGTVKQLRQDILEARKSGARYCAPEEFASAEAYLEFALVEIHLRNFIEADSYLATAKAKLDRAAEHLVNCRTDIDLDGVIDIIDEAPYQAEDIDGFADADGKPDPDNDNDGIPDIFDADPNLPEDFDGFADADGKPDLDNDGDGIPDLRDGAPNDPEDFDNFADNDGKPDPDNDLDGFLDADDACPNEPETFNRYKDKDGCPDVRPLIRKIISVGSVKFYSGSSRLTREAFPILEDFYEALEANPEIRVRIEGHTDAVGDEKVNMLLSQQRAERVKAVLVGLGTDADRLEVVGCGATRPLADNDTLSGRARNRRIDFVILQKPSPIFSHFNQDTDQTEEESPPDEEKENAQ